MSYVYYMYVSIDISLFVMRKTTIFTSNIYIYTLAIYIDWVLNCIDYSELISGLEIMHLYILQ